MFLYIKSLKNVISYILDEEDNIGKLIMSSLGILFFRRKMESFTLYLWELFYITAVLERIRMLARPNETYGSRFHDESQRTF